jgi:hypothetical protein
MQNTTSRLFSLNYLSYVLCMGSLIIGCDDETPSSTELDIPQDMQVVSDQMLQDRSVEPIQDALIDMEPSAQDLDISDMEWTFDLAVVEEEYSERADDVDRIYSGYAEKSLGFPLGIGTVGFFPAPGGFNNPFAPSGTDVQHTDLTARALLIREGDQSLVLLRTDTAAMWQDFIVDIKRELRDRGRGDLADGLIIGATHTHASGGKIISHPILRLLAGQFSPALYHRVLRNITEVILEADANVSPAQVGYDTIQVSSLHSDRRCENGDVIDDSMGLLKVTDEEGNLKAVLVNYAMHATVISSDAFLLSTDATGAIERGVEQRLTTHAPVLYFQSWAGDMSPKVPREHITQEGSEPHRKYRDLAAIGKEAAEIIIPALNTISVSPNVDLDVKTIRFPMNNRLINSDGRFDRYPHGGAYCYPVDSSNCPEDGEEQRVYTSDDLACLIAIPESDGIKWGQIAAVKLGELGMVSLPGEPLTSIGTELRDRAVELTGLEQVWVLGYTQGYLGYLLHPDDYFLGGYEGAGGIWGPGLGQFLVDRGVEIIAHLIDKARPLSFLPIPLPEKAEIPLEEIVYEEALGVPSWTESPQRLDAGYWTAEWIGGDPALDTPYVYLETSQIDVNGVEEWTPFTHQSGLLWDSHGSELELSIHVDPSYREQSEQIGRHFYWRVNMTDRFSVVHSIGALNGRFRWVVTGQSPAPYQLESTPFDINLD